MSSKDADESMIIVFWSDVVIVAALTLASDVVSNKSKYRPAQAKSKGQEHKGPATAFPRWSHPTKYRKLGLGLIETVRREFAIETRLDARQHCQAIHFRVLTRHDGLLRHL